MRRLHGAEMWGHVVGGLTSNNHNAPKETSVGSTTCLITNGEGWAISDALVTTSTLLVAVLQLTVVSKYEYCVASLVGSEFF